jgi:hypothetical protein
MCCSTPTTPIAIHPRTGHIDKVPCAHPSVLICLFLVPCSPTVLLRGEQVCTWQLQQQPWWSWGVLLECILIGSTRWYSTKVGSRSIVSVCVAAH